MSSYSKNADAIAKLTPEQYRVTQQSGTKRPGTGEYLDNKEPGLYVDIVLAELHEANRAGQRQGTARHFARHDPHGGPLGHGDSHLGHVFPDGPKIVAA